MGGEAAGTADVTAIAAEALAAIDSASSISPFTSRHPGFGINDAYAVTAELRRRRTARGERQVGRKIGFTNRNIWEEYNVHAPVWGDMYDTTVHDLSRDGMISLSRFIEPRIEPEIVFGLSDSVTPDMDDDALLDRIEWIAHGFEIVHSVFPGWRFQGIDTVAANGVHGALLLGDRHPPARMRTANLADALAGFTITLRCDGDVIDHGKGSNVLGSPLSALRHLAEVLARDPVNPPLRPGEIITTGTLTRAFPVTPGQIWTTAIEGIALQGLAVTTT